jgi:glucosamine 6-phosphate synthetase-like amidotransferase/phosphosugar isomerase protein
MAGELKHGPLALVDDTMPVMMIMTKDKNYYVGSSDALSYCTYMR